MNHKDEFLEELTLEEMDLLLREVAEKDYALDPAATERIAARTREKLGQGRKRFLFPLRWILAAMAVFTVLGLFIPQVQATVRQLFTFIPGVGAVTTNAGGTMLLGVDVSVTRGDDRVLEKPILFADAGGIQLTLQLKRGSVGKEEAIQPRLKDFKAWLNGTELNIAPTGFTASSDRSTVFGLYFQASPKAGDTVRIEQAGTGVVVEGRLKVLEAADPLSLPHASAAGVTVMADPVQTDRGWDLYMYSVSDTVIPITFSSDMQFTEPLTFVTVSGRVYPVETPTSYGTGFLPPLKLGSVAEAGELIIPRVSYRTRDRASYRLTIPRRGEALTPRDGFSLGGVAVTVDRVYFDEANEGRLSLDLSWKTGTTSLDTFQVAGSASSSWEPGHMTVSLTEKLSLAGRRTLEFSQPEFSRNEELRIPLDLTGKSE